MMHARYRPEIDGLRALAVLAVVVFHLDRTWLPGGFAGVDVFFVLSGYLITGILLRGLADRSFTFAAFYQRRIARIFPAFLLMALVTLGAASFLFTGWDLASAGKAFSAALLSTANFHLLMQGDYFQMSADAQPLLHCWSLAVEEQFYLLLPLALWLLRKRTPRQMLKILSALTAVSLVLCLIITPLHPAHAFYLLPTRAWELLAGSLLAAVEMPGATRPGAMAYAAEARARPKLWNWVFSAGMVAVLGSFALLREGPAFPGCAAMLPVAGTVAVLLATGRLGVAGMAVRDVDERSGDERTRMDVRAGMADRSRRDGDAPGAPRAVQWLACGPLTAIGRVSYSLYLWHWPVFSLVDYAMIFSSPVLRLVVKLLLTLVLTLLSYRLVEVPCRRWLNEPSHRRAGYIGFAVVLVALVPAGYALSRHFYIDAGSSRTGVVHFPASGESPRRVMLMGDSQACMFANVLHDICAAESTEFSVIAHAGTDPLNGAASPAGAHWQSSLEAVQKTRPDLLILSCHWIYKLQHDPQRLRTTLDALQPHCGRILLLTMPPLLPESAQRPAIRAGNRPPFREEEADRLLRGQMNALVNACSGPAPGKISVLDTAAPFLTPHGELLVYAPHGPQQSWGLPVLWFHSNAHLSLAGTQQLQTALHNALQAALQKSAQKN